jgi:alcohol dehydrogenase (cytochrome c)
MTPQLYDSTVLISTIPGNGLSNFYRGNGDGIVWALDAATGKPNWKFNTISDGAKLWGNAKVNSGGGLWYPPAVDSLGRVFVSVANPAPLYGTKKGPSSRSGQQGGLFQADRHLARQSCLTTGAAAGSTLRTPHARLVR